MPDYSWDVLDTFYDRAQLDMGVPNTSMGGRLHKTPCI